MSDPVVVYSNLSRTIPNGAAVSSVTVDIPDDMWASWFFVDSSGNARHTPFAQGSIGTVSDNNPSLLPGDENGAPFIVVSPHGLTTIQLHANHGAMDPYAPPGGVMPGIGIKVTDQRLTTVLSSNYSSFSTVTVSLTGLSFAFVMGFDRPSNQPGANAADVDSLFLTETALVVPGSAVSRGRSWGQVIG